MITVAYHADLKEVQGDAALAALLDSPAQVAPFDRLAWWQGLADDCGMRPLLAVARDTGGAMAVLPLAQGPDGLTALANWYSFRMRPLVSPGADARALLGALARDLRNHAGRITLALLANEGGETRLLADAFRKAGWIAFLEQCDSNHVLPLRGRSYAEYLATRPGALRSSLKRKAKKVDIQIYGEFLEDTWNIYENVYKRSWKPREGSPAFLRHFAKAEGAAGRLRLGIARAGGKPVAAQFWTLEGGTAFAHKFAYVEEARALSPGTVLTAAMFAQAIDSDGAAMVDFGTGDDAYKRDWMEEVRPRFRLELLRPDTPRQWPRIARQTARLALRRLAGAGRGG